MDFKLRIMVLGFLFASCATNKGSYKTESEVERQLMRMNKKDILVDLGPPDSKVEIAQGEESWRYSSEVGGLTGGECTLKIIFKDEKPTKAVLSANDLSWVGFPLGSCSKIIQTLRRGE